MLNPPLTLVNILLLLNLFPPPQLLDLIGFMNDFDNVIFSAVVLLPLNSLIFVEQLTLVLLEGGPVLVSELWELGVVFEHVSASASVIILFSVEVLMLILHLESVDIEFLTWSGWHITLRLIAGCASNISCEVSEM